MSSDTSLLNETVFGDLERELTVTRKVLERCPQEHYSWKPHPKSMSLGQMAVHVADMPEWMRATIGQDELDSSKAPRAPSELRTCDDLLLRYERNVVALREAVAKFDMANLNTPWSMRNGAQVVVTRPRILVYRIWCINHMIHHRAQLCVYLRLLNVPVPRVYFNTADEPAFVYE
jgi:uncharacterized damage-inducible protein DinB